LAGGVDVGDELLAGLFGVQLRGQLGQRLGDLGSHLERT